MAQISGIHLAAPTQFRRRALRDDGAAIQHIGALRSKARLKQIYQQVADEIMAAIAKLEPCVDKETFP